MEENNGLISSLHYNGKKIRIYKNECFGCNGHFCTKNQRFFLPIFNLKFSIKNYIFAQR